MIRTIDIRLNAAHPELPLPEATTYQGAPSTAFLRGVPKSCGLWQITAVSVAVTFPDNSTTTRAAVLSAGDVWVATIPACATSGRTTSGLRILADGTDENGDAVTGYVLGVADLAVATFDIAPAPGETSYALRYFDNVPNPPHKGDVAKIGGVLKYYDGAAWQVFADVDLSNYATKADATLAERGFSEWSFSDGNRYNIEVFYDENPSLQTPWHVGVQNAYGNEFYATEEEANYALAHLTSFTFAMDPTVPVTATRTALAGYQLGSQSDKPLASEVEAEALRTEKANKNELSVTPGTGANADKTTIQLKSGTSATVLTAHQQLVPVYGDPEDATWTFTYPSGYEGGTGFVEWVSDPSGGDHWEFTLLGTGDVAIATSVMMYDPNANVLTGTCDGQTFTATRTNAPVSYQLGDQSTRKLATAAQGLLALTAVQPSALPASETWTFEVDDGQGGTTTVTKSVAIYAAGANA